MQIATPPIRPQAIAGGPSFSTLEGWELLTAPKLAAVAAATPSAFASHAPSAFCTRSLHSIAPRVFQIVTWRDLKTHLSIRKQRTNVISDRQSFGLGGTLVPAAQIANRSLAPAISNRYIKPYVAVRNSHENRAQKRRANSKFQFSIFQSLQVQGVSPQEPCLRS
jgi:hypothetical protein